MFVDIMCNGWDNTWYAITELNEIICAGYNSPEACMDQVEYLIPNRNIKFNVEEDI